MDNPLRDADIPVSGLQAALTAARRGITSKADICALIVQIVDGDYWQERVILRTGETAGPFRTFEEFVTTPPMAGLGADMALIRSIVQDDPKAMDALDRALQGRQGERTDLVNNVNKVAGRPQGNTRAAGIRRLRKDRPDLHERVIAGEMKVNAAMIEAGFRPKTRSVALDPERIAALVIQEFDPEQIAELIERLIPYLPLE